MGRGPDEHKWEWGDDVVVFYLQRYPDKPIGFTDEEVCSLLGITNGALSYRKGNLKAVEGQGGFTHPAELTKLVYESLKDLPEPLHRAQALGILKWKSTR